MRNSTGRNFQTLSPLLLEIKKGKERKGIIILTVFLYPLSGWKS
jgi:hypothetical protein